MLRRGRKLFKKSFSSPYPIFQKLWSWGIFFCHYFYCWLLKSFFGFASNCCWKYQICKPSPVGEGGNPSEWNEWSGWRMRCPDIWRVSTKFQLSLFENLLIHRKRSPFSHKRRLFVSLSPIKFKRTMFVLHYERLLLEEKLARYATDEV